MITLFVALSAAAVAGAAAGRWVYARVRAVPGPVDESPPKERGPIALGDVIVLEGGRGRELWVARELALCEAGAAPWLVLFEADGPASARAILAWDPSDTSSFAVLVPTTSGGPAQFPRHFPSTIEVEIEGAPTSLALVARRTSIGVLDVAPNAEGASDLVPQGELQVATYQGGARGFAVVAKCTDRARLYSGHRVSFHEVSVLQVDPDGQRDGRPGSDSSDRVDGRP